MLTCEILRDADRPLWEDFVRTRPQCGIYHRLGWKDAIESAYGHSAPYLVAKRGDDISGVLPLVMIASRIFGKSLTSMPFLDFGGIVADDDESHRALLEKSCVLGRELGVDLVELRQLEPSDGDLETSTQKVLMELHLAADEEVVWSALSSERRNRVRRAIKSGLSVEVAGLSKLPVFYDIWTKNMRDLGSPPHSLAFFEAVLKNFGKDSALLLVAHEGRYVGAAMALFWKETLIVPWVSSLRDSFRLYPNNILYWEAMRYAVQNNLCIFDFGRSTKGSGTYEFKQRWGAVAKPLYWQFLPIGRSGVVVTADDSKFQLATRVWKKIPVSITRLIGPAVRKNITA